ncbi:oxidoreductase [Candidatus Desantisbacteria bacterium CG_4_9_14_3_um_filter_40_11]|uniref:Oxidoreductase n=3 Tax=unclassified Candidatus Desantisiibacteriota TaxID=3106372 RepID=A0A2M7JCS5_9BACT|nr:MAG: oxidoreductase [Candidatus Desantisbacteria bacterium CG_4_8_14_3_um_filter_40_12]PJB28950.1 MAG: oxidoreductase [Candidatus Desantisbacteria bacterium CG_4_9_14_3_um_filter_40_11]
MKQVVRPLNGEIRIEDVPMPCLKKGLILVKNVCSLISVGTERAIVESSKKNLLEKAMERPDQIKQVLENIKEEGIVGTYERVQAKLETIEPIGYSSAGIVVAVGEDVASLKSQDRVACAGVGWANHAEYVCVPKNLCVKIPEEVSFEDASFTTVGAIALHGVRQAQVSVGENIAVIGLGLLGQLTIQILKAAGCQVLGIDIDAQKVELAKELGADMSVIRGRDEIKNMAANFSYGYGVDGVIITASAATNDPIVLAGEICRDRGRVIVVGAVNMDVPRENYYMKELNLILSRSYGPGRYDKIYEEKGLDYPVGYVRWTEQRNMEGFLRLIAQGQINMDKIITHRFKMEDAVSAYNMISSGKKRIMGIVIDYGEDISVQESRIVLEHKEYSNIKKERIIFGFIGAGSFAQGFLLPHFKKIAELKGVVTGTGPNAKTVAKRFGFQYCTNRAEDVFEDKDINTIAIATRHNTHVSMVINGLKNGKIIFVEKPLALSIDELKEIITIQQETNGQLMVGFNRRFSPLIKKTKEFFQDRTGRLIMHYRVNAGFIPKNNWMQDSEEGGERIIGEGCHFVDLLQYISGSEPETVYAVSLPIDGGGVIANDNTAVTIVFKDGSIGTIHYIACGDSSFSKERIEIFGNGSVAVIDNFISGLFVKNGKTKECKLKQIDKGHKEEVFCFGKAVKKGEKMPIPFREIVVATFVTFKIMESLKKREAVRIDMSELGM